MSRMKDQQVVAEARAISGIEIRAEDGERAHLVGYAAVFNTPSVDLGGFTEIIRPGAFTRTLRGADVRALVEHDPALIIGRTRAKTLTVVEDDRGLRVDITPPDTQAGRDIVESVRLGNVDGMSFQFVAVKQRWTIEQDGAKLDLRELLDVDLFDVSVVTWPAYPKTDVGIRSLALARAEWEAARAEQRERIEAAARAAAVDAGWRDRQLQLTRRR